MAEDTTNVWLPIDCAEIQTKARESLNEIVEELQAVDTRQIPAFDLCEHALLYAYLGLEITTERWHEKSLDCLNLAIERLCVLPPTHNGFYGGLAGVGWLVQHVSTVLSVLDIGAAGQDLEDDEDALCEIDTRLVNQLNIGHDIHQNYDLISGIVGIGLYWLERFPRRRAIRGLEETIKALESASRESPAGVTWFTPPLLIPPLQKEWAPDGYYNLGVAHGVPGVVAFLAQVASLDLNDEVNTKALLLLERSARWLFAQQRPPGSLSRYSSWTTCNEDRGDSRVAWCYGDLGIAGVLHLAARSMQNPIWMSEAISMAHQCVSRRADTKVFDAPLCHGAFGIAHIYNRLNQAHSNDLYKQAIIDWTLKGLAMRKQGVGVAGFYAWDPAQVPPERADTSFLSGVIGVALALLSLISHTDPQWDRMLLLSGVPPAGMRCLQVHQLLGSSKTGCV